MDKGAASSAPFFCARMALVETRKGSAMAEEGILHDGIYRVGDVRVSDLAGRKRLPIGDSVFESVVGNKVYIDKSMLIADVLDSGAVATLFCRPLSLIHI